MKLTKAAREELRYALRNLERGFDYLMNPDVVVTRKSRMASADVFHRTGFDDTRLSAITKEYGSDLVGLKNAIDALGQFLATH